MSSGAGAGAGVTCLGTGARAGVKKSSSGHLSFTLWQQATIKITRHAHSISACLRQRYIWVFFFLHIPFFVNHTFNATLSESLQHLQPGWARLFEMTESERDK